MELLTKILFHSTPDADVLKGKSLRFFLSFFHLAHGQVSSREHLPSNYIARITKAMNSSPGENLVENPASYRSICLESIRRIT